MAATTFTLTNSGRGGYNAPVNHALVDAGRGGYNGPNDDDDDADDRCLNFGRGGYNKTPGSDDDEEEDGRGGYN
jgi:hypothetical protein